MHPRDRFTLSCHFPCLFCGFLEQIGIGLSTGSVVKRGMLILSRCPTIGFMDVRPRPFCGFSTVCGVPKWPAPTWAGHFAQEDPRARRSTAQSSSQAQLGLAIWTKRSQDPQEALHRQVASPNTGWPLGLRGPKSTRHALHTSGHESHLADTAAGTADGTERGGPGGASEPVSANRTPRPTPGTQRARGGFANV